MPQPPRSRRPSPSPGRHVHTLQRAPKLPTSVGSVQTGFVFVVLLMDEELLQTMKGVSTEDNLDCKCLLKIDFSASVAEKVGCVLPLLRSRRAADEEPSLLLPLNPVSVPSRPLPPGVGLYHPVHSRSHRRKRARLESAMMRSHFLGGTAARLFITETHVPVFRVPAL